MSRKNKIEKALRGLEHIEESVREKAVAILARSGDPKVLPALERTARNDQSLKIRFLAKEALQRVRMNLTSGAGFDLGDLDGGGKSGPRPIDVDRLKKYLENSDPARRNKAVKAAIAYLNPAALDVVVPHLRRERNLKVKGNCILALGILGGKEQVSLILHYLEHKNAHLRACAAVAASHLHEITVYPRLVHSLSDRDHTVRKAAFKALVKLGKPRLVKLLDKMVHSGHTWMRLAAARACGKFLTSRAVPVLAVALGDSKPEVAKAARASLRRLSRKGVDGASRLLDEYRRSGGEMTDLQLPDDLRFAGSPLNDEDPSRRLAAVQEMVREKDTAMLEAARARLEVEQDEKVLASLIMAVGRLGGPESIGALRKFLSSGIRRVKASAVEALSFIDDPAVVPLLVPMLRDGDNRVRCNAIVALKNESGIDVITPLRELAESENRNDKLSAIYAILELQRPEATDILGILQSDTDSQVRQKVQQALRILSDSRLAGEDEVERRNSAPFEIPQELTVQAPSDDAIQPSTASGTPVRERASRNDRSGDYSSVSGDDTASSTTGHGVGGKGDDGVDSGTSKGTEQAQSGHKSLPGIRTQIDNLFAQAAKEPPRKKDEKGKNGKKTKEPPKVDRAGFFQRIKDALTGSEQNDAPEEEGAVNFANIIIICTAAVTLFLLFYMLVAGGDESYDDENYDDEDF